MPDLKATRDRDEKKAACPRPQMSFIGYHGAVHAVRGTTYGGDKYFRGNYHGPVPEGVDPVERFMGYVDAGMRHLMKISQAYNVAKGTGGDLRAACAVVDDEASGGFPPSMLPHISHVIAGMMIAVECAVHDGILPADPGQPWMQHPMYKDVLARRAAGQPPSTHAGKSDVEIRTEQGLPQKDDPDSERRRIESLRGATPPFPYPSGMGM